MNNPTLWTRFTERKPSGPSCSPSKNFIGGSRIRWLEGEGHDFGNSLMSKQGHIFFMYTYYLLKITQIGVCWKGHVSPCVPLSIRHQSFLTSLEKSLWIHCKIWAPDLPIFYRSILPIISLSRRFHNLVKGVCCNPHICRYYISRFYGHNPLCPRSMFH